MKRLIRFGFFFLQGESLIVYRYYVCVTHTRELRQNVNCILIRIVVMECNVYFQKGKKMIPHTMIAFYNGNFKILDKNLSHYEWCIVRWLAALFLHIYSQHRRSNSMCVCVCVWTICACMETTSCQT